VRKFEELEPGNYFIHPEFDDVIMLKIFWHNLSQIVNEGQGGHAVNIKTGLVSFFADFEIVYCTSLVNSGN